MFATDRDLLVLEPGIFRDVGWAAQSRLRATGSVASGVLTVTGVNFAGLGVTTGHVVVFDGVPMEVLTRLSNTTLGVSLIRADGGGAGAAITPGDASNRSVSIATFAPQIEIVHRQILRMAGIGEDRPGADGSVTGESAIVNPAGLRLLESLGALHLVFASAASVAGDGSSAMLRAKMYRERFDAERARVGVILDLDGDGLADARRTLQLARLIRG